LAAAYEKIISTYRSSLSPTRQFDAFFALKEAGAPLAVELPVNTVSPKLAAAILNDYGYFAGITKIDRSSAEAALRRTIEVDPDRAVAYLNLADLLISRLGEISDSKAHHAAEGEIAALYRRYFE
jgi:hypothetical protein